MKDSRSGALGTRPQGRGARPRVPSGARVFSHTADVGLEITGASLDDLFRHAADGFARLVARGPGELARGETTGHPAAGHAVATPEAPAGAAGTRSLPVTLPVAPDPEALLVDWLNFLIYVLETEALIPAGCEVKVAGGTGEGWTLTGTLAGACLGRGQPVSAVKAATYHGLKITESKQGLYRARVILDV